MATGTGGEDRCSVGVRPESGSASCRTVVLVGALLTAYGCSGSTHELWQPSCPRWRCPSVWRRPGCGGIRTPAAANEMSRMDDMWSSDLAAVVDHTVTCIANPARRAYGWLKVCLCDPADVVPTAPAITRSSTATVAAVGTGGAAAERGAQRPPDTGAVRLRPRLFTRARFRGSSARPGSDRGLPGRAPPGGCSPTRRGAVPLDGPAAGRQVSGSTQPCPRSPQTLPPVSSDPCR